MHCSVGSPCSWKADNHNILHSGYRELYRYLYHVYLILCSRKADNHNILHSIAQWLSGIIQIFVFLYILYCAVGSVITIIYCIALHRVVIRTARELVIENFGWNLPSLQCCSIAYDLHRSIAVLPPTFTAVQDARPKMAFHIIWSIMASFKTAQHTAFVILV